MVRFFAISALFWAVLTKLVWAQSADDVVWVQIEAQPTFEEAIERAETYARDLPDINGFALSSGWFAIALGPYQRDDAEEVLRLYRAQGLIPSDSYIAFSRIYRQQYWPENADTLGIGSIATVTTTPAISQSGLSEITVPEAPRNDTAVLSQTDPETPAQARRSESLLTRSERQELQTALQWVSSNKMSCTATVC